MFVVLRVIAPGSHVYFHFHPQQQQQQQQRQHHKYGGVLLLRSRVDGEWEDARTAKVSLQKCSTPLFGKQFQLLIQISPAGYLYECCHCSGYCLVACDVVIVVVVVVVVVYVNAM